MIIGGTVTPLITQSLFEISDGYLGHGEMAEMAGWKHGSPALTRNGKLHVLTKFNIPIELVNLVNNSAKTIQHSEHSHNSCNRSLLSYLPDVSRLGAPLPATRLDGCHHAPWGIDAP